MQWKGMSRGLGGVTTTCSHTLWLALVVFLCLHECLSESLIQTVSGALYMENITFYELHGDGVLRLELHSLKGDADLYISSQTRHPTYSNNELKSENCGLDVVEVPSTMKRPLGIGIYGSPLQPDTIYKLNIFFVAESEVDEYEQLFQTFHYYDYDEESKGASDSQAKQGGSKYKSLVDRDSNEEDSVWWTILVTVLKFVLEVIM